MENRIKVLLVDDHALFRGGVAGILSKQGQFEVAGQAANGEEAVRKARELTPDVILMDVQMPICNGVDATRLLREDGFSKSIVMLTVSERDDDLFDAMKNGANGYILKNAEIEELVAGIIHAARGETVISPVMATKLISELKTDTRKKHRALSQADTLSEREEAILRLVASGDTNKEIATALYITENTVKCHMRNIMSKLHLKNRYAIVAYAFRRE